MRTIGIIVEYNPMQNGHLYQLNIARQVYHADYIILVMTSNFNERGLPAIIPKENRAMAGINGGADLVLELPACYSLGDLPTIALGAIGLFEKIGIVDYLLFGSESGKINEIQEMSEILGSQKYLSTYHDYYEKTQITSLAREKTLKTIGYENYSNCINNPNNLLGVTFLLTIKKINSRIIPISNKRIGQPYLDDSVNEMKEGKIYSSSSAVRRLIKRHYLESGELPVCLKNCVPEYVYEDMVSSFNKCFPVFNNDFEEQIYKSIKTSSKEYLEGIDGIDSILARELFNNSREYSDFDLFDKHIRGLFPHVNMDRRYYRILTNQLSSDLKEYEREGIVFYARILAEGVRAKNLIDAIKERSLIPVFRAGEEPPPLTHTGLKQFKNDQYAEEIYKKVVKNKFGRNSK